MAQEPPLEDDIRQAVVACRCLLNFMGASTDAPLRKRCLPDACRPTMAAFLFTAECSKTPDGDDVCDVQHNAKQESRRIGAKLIVRKAGEPSADGHADDIPEEPKRDAPGRLFRRVKLSIGVDHSPLVLPHVPMLPGQEDSCHRCGQGHLGHQPLGSLHP